jgi:hypothetical protein
MITRKLKAGALIRPGQGRRRAWLALPVKATLWALLALVACGFLPATSVSPGPVSLQAAELAEPREDSGVIDYIEEGRIVIDDTGYKFSELVVYYRNSSLQDQIPRSRFKVGKIVGFTVHTDGKIIEIWLE